MAMKTIEGFGSPREDTVGEVGQAYLDKNTGAYFKCVNIYKTTGWQKGDVKYRWVKVDTIFGNNQADWNELDPTSNAYIKNTEGLPRKISKYETTTWDGNVDGRAVINDMFFKVSDQVLTKEQLVGSTMTVSGITENGIPTEFLPVDCVITESMIVEQEGAVMVAPSLSVGDSMIPTIVSVYDIEAVNKGKKAEAVTPTNGLYALYVPPEMLDQILTSTFGAAAVERYPIFMTSLSNTKLDTLSYEFMPEGYPKKSGWRFTFDGSIAAIESSPKLQIPDTSGYYVKVSDETPSYSDLENATIVWHTPGGDQSISLTAEILSNEVITPMDAITAMNEAFVIVREIDESNNPLAIPETGTYLFAKGTDLYVSSLSNEVITPMDPKFLPNGGGGGVKYCVFTQDENGNYSASMTYDEIAECVVGGSLVVGVYGERLFYLEDATFMSQVSTYVGIPASGMKFVSVDPYFGFYSFMLTDNNNINFEEHEIQFAETT